MLGKPPVFRSGNLKAVAAIVSLLLAMSSPVMSLSKGQTQSRGVGVKIKVEGGKVIDLYDQSHALVIGVSEYTKGLPSLPGVVRDVEAVSAALGKQGFQTEVLMNPTRATFDQVMRGFIRRWGQSAQNRLLIYFAGHGYTFKTIDGRDLGYIVPADAPLPSEDIGAFKETAISMSEIENYAYQIESKHVMFVFDSCFSGSLFEAMRAVPDAIASKTALPVRQFITAGTAEQTVPDNSIFSRQFVEGLSGEADLNKDGYVTGSELGMFLENSVTNYSHRAQTPRYGKIRNPKLDKGDFVFALPESFRPSIAEGAVSQPPAIDPLAVELKYWETIQNSHNPEDFKAYLQEYPNGRFAALARLRVVEAPTKSESKERAKPLTVDVIKRYVTQSGGIIDEVKSKPDMIVSNYSDAKANKITLVIALDRRKDLIGFYIYNFGNIKNAPNREEVYKYLQSTNDAITIGGFFVDTDGDIGYKYLMTIPALTSNGFATVYLTMTAVAGERLREIRRLVGLK